MKVKLADIAKESGYSINTVSRALRRDPKISKGTCQIIQQTADQLGYIRNHVAGSMRSNRTNTIGIVSADSSNPFFAEVIVGIEDTARRENFHILLINTEENADSEYEAVKLLLGRQVDGLIIMPVFDNPRNCDLYNSLPIPFVFAGRRVNGIENHSILHGDIDGGRNVFRYLIEAGHQQILYIAGPSSISNSVDRKEGMMQIYKEYGIPENKNLLIETSGHIDDGYTAVNKSLNKGLEFSAVACFNDLLAMGVLKSLYENDLSVPDDIEVFGYDNLNMAQYMQPRLSSVDVPKARLGQIAVEELISHIEDKNKEYRTVNINPRLVFRETTRR